MCLYSFDSNDTLFLEYIEISIISKEILTFLYFSLLLTWSTFLFPFHIFQHEELGITVDELSPLALTFRAPIFQSLLKAFFFLEKISNMYHKTNRICFELFFWTHRRGGGLHTQNECRMYDAGRTTVTEMIWLDLQGDVRNNDILEERHKDHTSVFDEFS